MEYQQILDQLPYQEPFLFVEGLTRVNEQGVMGYYTFPPDADYFRGHFKDHPVTPGVLLTECLAQIGLVCLGIYLLRNSHGSRKVALSSTEVDFFLPVLPAEQVTVTSEKLYFRFGKLKCRVWMYNQEQKLVCKGVIAGMCHE